MKLQSFLENAGKEACLCIDYCWAVAEYLGAPDDMTKIALTLQTCIECYDSDILGQDFFVKDPVRLMKTCARLAGYPELKVAVEKLDIESYKDLPEKKYAAVRHDYNGNSHFVLAYNKTLCYDSLDDSKCVRLGKPTTARVITFLK